MRHVQFSPDAERQRTDLPLRRRWEIDRAIRAIAERSGRGVLPNAARATDPGTSNLIADLSVRDYAIVCLIRSADDVVWIEYIGPVVKITSAAMADRDLRPIRRSSPA